MKALILAFSLVLCSAAAVAQFSVETTDYEGVVPLTSFTDHQVLVYNELGDSLHLGWKFINNTCPSEWTYALCDFGFCYDGIPPSGIMQAVPDGANAFLKLSVWANGVAGSGGITFWVYEQDTPEDYQQITFWFNMAPLSVAEPSNDSQLKTWPNPASDLLRISSELPASFALYSSTGQLVLDASTPAVSWTVNAHELPAGVYQLYATSTAGTEVRAIVIQP